MPHDIKDIAISSMCDNRGKKTIYDFLHSTKIRINSERKLALSFEEGPYVFASPRQPLCGSLPLPINYKTPTKVRFTDLHVYHSLQSESGFRWQHRQQTQQRKHQDTKILPIHLLTSRSSQISLGFQEKFRHQVFPIMSRSVVSAGEVGPDPILHQQEN